MKLEIIERDEAGNVTASYVESEVAGGKRARVDTIVREYFCPIRRMS